MKFSKVLIIPGVFLFAALLALVAAFSSVNVIERVSKAAVEQALILGGQDWANVHTDGLQLVLSGMAPTESDRFRAISIAGGEVDSSRVIDQMEVPNAAGIEPPRFSVEILRNDGGISMIGLIPNATDREALNARVRRIAPEKNVADLLETADYDVPENWSSALDFALVALERLPRAKISMDASRVTIEAIADSAEQRTTWERDLARAAPGGLRVAMNISAPRPVITPFTTRFVIDDQGARFDACTAGTEAGRVKIVAAGIASGVKGRPTCTIGLGVPSPDWPDAVSRGVRAVRELGAGTITFSDADVTLVAPASVEQQNFDRVVGELEADLPDVFSLHSTKTQAESTEGEGRPEFSATLSPEGQVQLRGRLGDEQQRTITESVARARFGMDKVYMAARLDENLPRGWSVRVLAAVEALSYLDNGVAIVQPELVELRGKTGDPNANAEISRLLSEKLGEAQDYRVNVSYDEALDPIASLPSPEECVAMINETIAGSKITFAPGSVEIEASAAATIDKIADVLRDCAEVPMEIGGHTDSQGSEELNKALSQQRANSVLNALLARRILTSNIVAHGYGEEVPIADNDTEAGREANRRIEFRLISQRELDGEPLIEGTPYDGPLGDIRPRPRPTAADADDTAEADETGDEGVPPEDEEYVAGDDGPPEGMDAETAAALAPEDDVEDAAAEGATEPTGDEVPAPETAGAEPGTDETDDGATQAEEVAETTEGEDPDAADETASADEETTNETAAHAADETPGEGVDETTETETVSEEALSPPTVVHPELEGVRAPPRPEREG
ncbi:MAG: OmpA family protein [Maritimibacter sp.]|uniref:OmpA family protein n=1 Tax=Maritimibacter sp. TaxID=2003363 RepID=UPI001DF8C309|nr:OmpA family protein [Maritimibacter sp.]MBL6428422.1 OmpA family protein [Maritimibacter sp.]